MLSLQLATQLLYRPDESYYHKAKSKRLHNGWKRTETLWPENRGMEGDAPEVSKLYGYQWQQVYIDTSDQRGGRPDKGKKNFIFSIRYNSHYLVEVIPSFI